MLLSSRITANAEVNKMSAKNIGIIFSHTLLRGTTNSAEVGRLPWMSGALATMIESFETVFPYGM